jgi:phage anti-repressor protein
MEDFIKYHTTLPNEFINDFFMISKDEYDEKDKIINFDLVIKWLEVTKGNLKRLLVDNFDKEFDYSIEKNTVKRKTTGATTITTIYITPNCFRELCMMSKTNRAKLVRKYFIEMENIVKKFHTNTRIEMEKTIGLLKANQKPKVNDVGGKIYILKALNSNVTLYKLGKTKDLKNRLNTYNSVLTLQVTDQRGNANDVEPLFKINVNNIQAIEDCVKGLVKSFQYRKHKEVYEIKFDILTKLMKACSTVYDEFLKEYKHNKEDFKSKVARAKGKEILYLYLAKNESDNKNINNIITI